MPTAREMKPVIIEAIREVLQEEVCTRLDKLEEKVDELYEMKHILLDHQEKIKDLENSLDFTDNHRKLKMNYYQIWKRNMKKLLQIYV